MQDLIIQKANLVELLAADLIDIRATGLELSQAEHDYRLLVSKETLYLRDKGMPVTIIGDVVRGLSHVAEARFKRDSAKVLYEAALEAERVHKLNLNIVQADLEREWRA